MKRFPILGAVLLATVAAWAADGPPPPFREGEVTRAGDLVAYLTHPVDRYRHGVFGRPVEAEGFAIERGGKRLEMKLAAQEVFEDRRVRLVDVTGDTAPEAVVVKTQVDKGAGLAVYTIGKTKIELLAETPPIGTAHRWLNPVGVVEMGQDGRKFIAAVITPHLGGSLRLYEVRGKAMAEVARLDGVTNHINGSRNLDLSVLQDVDGDGADDIVIPMQDRKALALVTLKGGKAQIAEKLEIKGGRVTEIAAQAEKGSFRLLLDTAETVTLRFTQTGSALLRR